MNTQYIFNAAGEPTSVIIPINEYEELLSAAALQDETAFLLREPNGTILRQRIKNIRKGCNIIERDLLPDED